MDPDHPAGLGLIYTLEGDDAAHFELLMTMVDDDGDDQTPLVPLSPQQLSVRSVTVDMPIDMDNPLVEFDHEDSDKNAYTVTLKATDATDLSDTLTVNIEVTGPQRGAGGAHRGPARAEHKWAQQCGCDGRAYGHGGDIHGRTLGRDGHVVADR